MNAIVMEACGESIDPDQVKDINDFKAHSDIQAELVGVFSSRTFLQKQFEAALEGHLGNNIPAADNPAIVTYCKYFRRNLKDIDMMSLALRYGCNEQLRRAERKMVKRFQRGSDNDRQYIEQFKSPAELKRLLKSALSRERSANNPADQDNYVLRLLKGLGFDPKACFENGIFLNTIDLEVPGELPDSPAASSDEVYFLRGRQISEEHVEGLKYRIMAHAMGTVLPKAEILEIEDFEAESERQRRFVELYRQEATLQLYYYLAVEDFMVSGEPVKKAPFLVQCCKHFKRPIEDLQISIWAVRNACHEKLSKKELAALNRVWNASERDREVIKSITSPQTLHRMIEDTLRYYSHLPYPIDENIFLRMLLKAVGLSPSEFFDKNYLLLKYDEGIVNSLTWSKQ